MFPQNTHEPISNLVAEGAMPEYPEFFERHVARLLVVLYTFGEPVADLLDLISGETRQIEPRARVAWLDFWLREPGHLALALIHAYGLTPTRFEAEPMNVAALRATLDRMLTDDQADAHRVSLPGGAFRPYGLVGDLDNFLAFLSSRGAVSDRPSFSKTGTHRILLDPAGLTFVREMLAACPSLGWYQAQCATIKTFLPILEGYDLVTMPYLGLSPAVAANVPLIPLIRERYARTIVEQA